MATDKRIKEGCPFCGTSFNLIQIYSNKHDVKWSGKSQGYFTKVYCPNPDCGVQVSGFGIMNVINRWNRRSY